MFECFKDKAFLRKFFKISIPVMLSAFITFLVSFVDNIMVGTVSNVAVSGVYAANEVSYIINMMIFGIIEGAGIFIQQFFGSGDDEHLKQSFCYKLIVSTLLLIIVIPIVYFFGNKMVYLFCYKDAECDLILSEGTKYLKVVLFSYIPYAIGMNYSSSLREIGETKYTFYSSLCAITCNIVFNYLFITVLNKGVVGAAIATILARTVEMLILFLISSIKKFPFCKKSFVNFKCEWKLFKNITKIGWILFINEIGYSVGMVLQSMAFSQRDGVLSSISIVTTVSNIFFILIQGLSVGIGVMVGSRLGANEFDKAIDENKKLLMLGFYMSIISTLILCALSFVIPYIFKEVTPQQKELATQLIIIYAVFLVGQTMAVLSYFTLRVGGKTKETFFLDTGLMIILYVPISWILAMKTNLNILWIYAIVRSLDIFKGIIGIILVKKKDWVVNLTDNKKNEFENA